MSQVFNINQSHFLLGYEIMSFCIDFPVLFFFFLISWIFSNVNCELIYFRSAISYFLFSSIGFPLFPAQKHFYSLALYPQAVLSSLQTKIEAY